MNTKTFSEQRDRIVNAYMNNTLTPFENNGCFVGNLMNGHSEWSLVRDFKPGVEFEPSTPSQEEIDKAGKDGIKGMFGLAGEYALKDLSRKMEQESPSSKYFWDNGGKGILAEDNRAAYMGGLVVKEEGQGFYSPQDLVDLENNFLSKYIKGGSNEDSLYEAMDSTLDLLQEIHIKNGEVIEKTPLQKRELVTV